MIRGFLIIATFLLTGISLSAQEDKPLQANPADDLFTLATVAYQEALATKDKGLRKAYYETALRQFAKFQESYPTNARLSESHYYSAVCHDKLGQADKAQPRDQGKGRPGQDENTCDHFDHSSSSVSLRRLSAKRASARVVRKPISARTTATSMKAVSSTRTAKRPQNPMIEMVNISSDTTRSPKLGPRAMR